MAHADDLRASDAEREAAAAHLREAAGDGRLDADEFERRLDAAYAARTRGELARLTSDLPAPPAPVAGAAPEWRSQALRRRAASFVTINVICVVVWFATGAHGGFWPGWVMLGTGVGFLAMLVRALFGVQDEREHERVERLPRPPRARG